MSDEMLRIEGLDDLEDRLMRLGSKEADRMTRQALMVGGRVIQEAIADLAPVRPELPSGTALPEGALKQDIELHIERGAETKSVQAVISPGSRTSYAAKWVEYGHRLVRGGYSRLLANGKTRGKGKQVGDVSAHPFIRPGFEASKAAAQDAVSKEFIRLFEEEAQK